MKMVGELKRLNKSIYDSFNRVKNDISELRKQNKKQSKIIQDLKNENSSLKKLLNSLGKETTFPKHYDFIERRLDELEEEIFNLENEKLDNKRFNSAVNKINYNIRKKENLKNSLNELKNFKADTEHFKLSLINLNNKLKELKKENKRFITKRDFEKRNESINKTLKEFIDIKNSVSLLELRFDEFENMLTEKINQKDLYKMKNRIYARIRKIENKKNIKSKNTFISNIKKFFE